MRRGATLAMALLLVSCAQPGTEAERLRDAARADSSAAGYDIGPLVASPPAPSHSSTSATAGVVAPRVTAPATGPRKIVEGVGKTAPPRPTLPAPRNPGTPAPIPPAPALAPVDTGPVQDGEFLWYHASRKLVKVRIVAGYSGVNDGLNFNGGTSGDRTVVVPLGWLVIVTVANEDETLMHSALVAAHELPVPPEPPAPAFEGARIASFARGLPNGESEEMRFTASRAGQFLLMCGVPGHGEGGMWISLEVSESAAVPAYR